MFSLLEIIIHPRNKNFIGCSANFICRKCNGKHILFAKKKQNNANSAVAFVDWSRSILLQTGQSNASKIEAKSFRNTRSLFTLEVSGLKKKLTESYY